MFTARTEELKSLNRHYASKKFELAVVYGRRRVGKTALLNEFSKDKTAIFYSAFETSAEENLVYLGRKIRKLVEDSELPETELMPYPSLLAALEALDGYSRRERVLLIIDDYQFLAGSSSDFPQLMQIFIDEKFRKGRLMMALGISSMTFAENQLHSEKGLLYDRVTLDIKLRPLSYFEAGEMLPGFSKLDLALVYGITGGVPLYLTQMDEEITAEENLARNFLMPMAPLLEEPQSLLAREVREAAYYNAILSAIASGCTKNAQIARRTGLQTSACTAYLNNLILQGVVCRETPMGQEKSRKTVYSITDSMLRFWYRFIPENYSMIQAGMLVDVWRRIRPRVGSFMHSVFVEICRQWLWRESALGRLPREVKDEGSWWGSGDSPGSGSKSDKNELDSLKKWLLKEHAHQSLSLSYETMGRWWGGREQRQESPEIDIMVFTDDGRAVFAQCVWEEEKTGADTLQELIDITNGMDYEKKHLLIFSRAGFSGECEELSRQGDGAVLITFEMMNRPGGLNDHIRSQTVRPLS